MIIITTILLILIFSFNPRTEYFLSKWALLLIISELILSFKVFQVTNVPIAALFFYAMASATYYAIYPFQNHFSNTPNLKNINLGLVTSKNLIGAMGLAIVLAFTPSSWVEYFFKSMPFVLLVVSISTLTPKVKMINVNGGVKQINTYGFSGNPSTNATFISFLAMGTLVYPVWYSYIILIISLAAILRTKASSGLGSFIAGISMFAICKFPLLITVIPFLIAYPLYKNPHLLNTSGRFEIAQDCIEFFWRIMNKLTGCGVGSMAFLFPVNQLKHPKCRSGSTNLALWLHNDALQWFFEGGFIGAVLILVVTLGFVLAAVSSPALAAFGACYVVASFTNFPNHLADTSLITVLFLRLSTP